MCSWTDHYCSFELNVYLSNNSLIYVYANCGNMGDTWKVFNSITGHDVITGVPWTYGYVKHEQRAEGISIVSENCTSVRMLARLESSCKCSTTNIGKKVCEKTTEVHLGGGEYLCTCCYVWPRIASNNRNGFCGVGAVHTYLIAHSLDSWSRRSWVFPWVPTSIVLMCTFSHTGRILVLWIFIPGGY